MESLNKIKLYLHIETINIEIKKNIYIYIVEFNKRTKANNPKSINNKTFLN